MTTRALQPAPDAAARGQFAGFAFLLAVATVFHEAVLGDWRPTHVTVTLAAVWVMLRPSSLTRFLVLVATQLIVFVDDLPEVANHWLVLSITNVTVLAYLAWAAITRRDWPISGGQLYRRLAPVLRLGVILVYLFAALAKMNHGFMDEVNGCARVLADDVFAWTFTPPGMDQIAPVLAVATIVIELSIPVALIFRRTRLLAVFVGIGFHTMLAVAGHAPFSGFAFVFYWLFLPDDMPERLARVRDRLLPLAADLRSRARTWLRSPAGAATAVAAVALAAGVAGWAGPPSDLREFLAMVAFLAFAVVATALLVLAVWDPAPLRWRPDMFRLPHPVLLIVPLALVANGLSPYLGLKTENSFTMYSNLRTEEPFWNHWFMPQEMQVFDMQDRPVRVIASSDERLQEAASDGMAMSRFAFYTETSRNPDDSVTYELDGRLRDVARIGSDPTLTDGPNPVLSKVLWFRDIPVADGSYCVR